MKISRLKLLSVLCFATALAIVVAVFIKDYSNSKNGLAFTQRNIKMYSLETAAIEEIDISKIDNIDSTEEEINSVENVEEKVEPSIVYDGLTLEELSNRLDRSLNSTLSSKGSLYASYSLEKGVDPYLAVAISLEETGCSWGCSDLVVSCNNVGGMKGSGCGSYAYFETIDDGIRAFIDNISNNYVSYGLTTAELMNPKYAENPQWSYNVNAYITRIKNN